MTPVPILLLSDGRPGHYRISEGVIAAVGRLRPVVTHTLEIRRPRWLGGPLALATNAGVAPSVVLEHVYGVRTTDLPPMGLIVSAGAETLAASIAIARQLAVPNIFYGSLRRFRAADFSLVLTSYERPGMAQNHRVTLKPSAIDPDRIVGAPATRRPGLVALVLGGSAPGCAWGTRDWDCLLRLTAAPPADGRRWVVANSRRTPPAVSDAFGAMASRNPGSLDFLDVRKPGSPSLAGILAAADIVVVTGDSSSMVSEGIWARRPVVAVMPDTSRLTADETRYRDWLAGRGWLGRLAIAELTLKRVETIGSGLTPMRSNPQADLAALVRAQLPQLFEAHG